MTTLTSLGGGLLWPAVAILLGIGLGVALGARHPVKRLAGLGMAQLAGVLALATLGGGLDPRGGALALAAAVAAMASLGVGAALLVRLGEAYGPAEADAIAASADAEAQASEQGG